MLLFGVVLFLLVYTSLDPPWWKWIAPVVWMIYGYDHIEGALRTPSTL